MDNKNEKSSLFNNLKGEYIKMVKTKKIVRLNYITRKYTISKEDIVNGKFEILYNRREKKKSTYKSVLDGLLNGISFEAPLIINEVSKTGVYEVIDGNNRFDAVETYVGMDDNNKVEVTLHVYTDLDDDQKKVEFTRWNKGKKQSTNDVVKQYEDEIPIFSMMKDTTQYPFPVSVSVYGSVSSMCFYRLVSAYIGAKHEGSFQGGFLGDPWKFVSIAKSFNDVDYKLIRAFVKDFLEAFGPLKNNPWLKTTPFTAIFRIWYCNYKKISSDKMITLFKAKLLNDFEAIDLHKISGMTATQHVRSKYVNMLNKDRSNNIFV